MKKEEVEDLGIWQAATLDGYWEHKATDDIQIAFLKGYLQACKSLYASYGYGAARNSTLKRMKLVEKELEQLANSPKETNRD